MLSLKHQLHFGRWYSHGDLFSSTHTQTHRYTWQDIVDVVKSLGSRPGCSLCLMVSICFHHFYIFYLEPFISQFLLLKLPHQACTAARNPCDSGVRHAGTHFSLEDAICGTPGPRTGWFHEDDWWHLMTNLVGPLWQWAMYRESMISLPDQWTTVLATDWNRACFCRPFVWTDIIGLVLAAVLRQSCRKSHPEIFAEGGWLTECWRQGLEYGRTLKSYNSTQFIVFSFALNSQLLTKDTNNLNNHGVSCQDAWRSLLEALLTLQRMRPSTSSRPCRHSSRQGVEMDGSMVDSHAKIELVNSLLGLLGFTGKTSFQNLHCCACSLLFFRRRLPDNWLVVSTSWTF